ncbi:MAG: hypothetical protein KJO40_05045 [Deltaproteobacteria bacterium]|nr:hypothetical protein [Deltaproteobacteria bacterium]NND28547.1 hypothetical protein [Myxococcales bacterium]MBT8464755.1 hypothetical protein [Deltaproteobacteria bacterium]MBT8482649.1 hypothetical protein [Deltaproteobacteria bacterium]NNK06714.1 hypothetical protein [Myxococcales bacterium]
MARLVFCVVCSALVAVVTGCETESGGSAGAGGTGGTAGTGGGETISVDFNIRSTELRPLEGAEICVADTQNCATTDEEGDATIELPFNMEVLYTVSKDGFVPELYGDVTDLTFGASRGHVLFPEQEISDGAVDIDTVWPHAGTGWLSLGVNQPSVTFTLVGDAREPWYVDADGNGSTVIDATTTESIGGARGGFVEVAPGVHEVEFGGAATDCVVGIGLPGTAANRIRVPVRDGHISYGSQACAAP